MARNPYVTMVTLLGALLTGAAAVWCLASPGSFADFVDFPRHEHFVHDLGAFQFGLAAALLLALVWADGLATALGGFLVANAVHAVNHAGDLDLGGRGSDPWLIGAMAVLAGVALVVRLRQLGWVVGQVPVAASPALAPFARQKTVLLTTYRRDGRPGASPVSIAVDGERAYVRSFEKSLKTRRLRRDPRAAIAPSDGRGHVTGPQVPARMRLLHGEENRYAARLLRAKHPFLHGVAVPLTHRLARAKTGRTVHFELTPDPAGEI
ncbi:PPOX class F420-dependent oxidoreductase [Phytohabitans sp. ZYX-F-186]|uniref:PPOX class F420-dependent oxidoreductase n=1 Tax=Phytohabitans maris TaxID=3071409 RepID=A0ABU0ZH88_9ACTN|nr:PPOX class F420-dependent oxidoreductase [Phytohabitans sp. ZYX-F-186]MDQ7906424.1 PPOX class F420-dependent oxidoreductase [Phytohabitans sp. ZYX-F-186]